CYYPTYNTNIYPLSLHDALPILETFGSLNVGSFVKGAITRKYAMGTKNTGDKFTCRKLIRTEVNCITEKYCVCILDDLRKVRSMDRKCTRVNSSHGSISYDVFCL